MKKRFFAATLALALIFCCLPLSAAATDEAKSTDRFVPCHCTGCCEHTDGEIELVGGADDKASSIILAYLNGEEAPESKGAMCDLFGHKNDIVVRDVITHKYKADSPRCIVENRKFYICQRCSNVSFDVLSYYYVVCCPVGA